MGELRQRQRHEGVDLHLHGGESERLLQGHAVLMNTLQLNGGATRASASGTKRSPCPPQPVARPVPQGEMGRLTWRNGAERKRSRMDAGRRAASPGVKPAVGEGRIRPPTRGDIPRGLTPVGKQS